MITGYHWSEEDILKLSNYVKAGFSAEKIGQLGVFPGRTVIAIRDQIKKRKLRYGRPKRSEHFRVCLSLDTATIVRVRAALDGKQPGAFLSCFVETFFAPD